MSEPITVLIVDDHAVVRHGIRALLEAEGGFAVVGGKDRSSGNHSRRQRPARHSQASACDQ